MTTAKNRALDVLQRERTRYNKNGSAPSGITGYSEVTRAERKPALVFP
jgi:hypothetical protein